MGVNKTLTRSLTQNSAIISTIYHAITLINYLPVFDILHNPSPPNKHSVPKRIFIMINRIENHTRNH